MKHNANGTATPPTAKLFYSVKETAGMLGVSRAYAYTLCDAGLLESRYIGRRRLIPAASLLAFIVGHRDTTPPERTSA